MGPERLRKIRAHRIKREETEEALLNDPIPVYEQDVEGERRFVYCGKTNAGRFLAVIVTERGDRIRVVPACDLDAGQRRDCIQRRTQGEWGQTPQMPRFKTENEEADWWASKAGRA